MRTSCPRPWIAWTRMREQNTKSTTDVAVDRGYRFFCGPEITCRRCKEGHPIQLTPSPPSSYLTASSCTLSVQHAFPRWTRASSTESCVSPWHGVPPQPHALPICTCNPTRLEAHSIIHCIACYIILAIRPQQCTVFMVFHMALLYLLDCLL